MRTKFYLVLSLISTSPLAFTGCGATVSHIANGGSTAAPVSSTNTGALEPLHITSPSAIDPISSPFTLAASGDVCTSKSIMSMSYQIDGGTTTVINGSSLNVQVLAAPGAHTLTVGAQGIQGEVCTTTISILVAQLVPVTSSSVPANAVTVSGLQGRDPWSAENDTGASGSSSGVTSVVTSPSLSNKARQFVTSFTNSGNERYWVVFGNDTTATNFFYDASVYIQDSAANTANLEFDMNQVMPNGQTVIFGFQCDGWNGTWDYTENAGTPQNPIDRWLHSTAPCNPHNWTPNVWHHLQVSYSRDNSGNVTYSSVWLDGVEQKINATVPSAFALGWGAALVTNFQVDGYNDGSSTIYLDNLSVARW